MNKVKNGAKRISARLLESAVRRLTLEGYQRLIGREPPKVEKVTVEEVVRVDS